MRSAWRTFIGAFTARVPWQNNPCIRCSYAPLIGYQRKFLSTSTICLKLRKVKMPPKPTIDEKDIEEKFIKGGGKGGQKINKTNSKVQLRHIPTGIVVNSQFTRSLTENRKDARKKLALAVDSYLYGDASWQAVQGDKIRKKISRAKQKSKANNLTKIAQKQIQQEIEQHEREKNDLFKQWQLNQAIQPYPQLEDNPLDIDEMLNDLKKFAISKGKPDAFDGFIEDYNKLYTTKKKEENDLGKDNDDKDV